jgi:hypothetical protein
MLKGRKYFGKGLAVWKNCLTFAVEKKDKACN